MTFLIILFWLFAFVAVIFVFVVVTSSVEERVGKLRRKSYGRLPLDELRTRFAKADDEMRNLTVEMTLNPSTRSVDPNEVHLINAKLYNAWIELASEIAQRESGCNTERAYSEARSALWAKMYEWSLPVSQKLKAEAEALREGERRKQEDARKAVQNAVNR